MQVTSTLRQANVLRLRFQVGATGGVGPQGPQGPTGPANSLAIGTVSTLPYGSPATATITGTPPSQTLDLGLPMGAQGPSGSVTDGDKGDITVSSAGTVWTIDAGAVSESKIADGAATTNKIGAAAVTNAKLADMATASFKGRSTAGTGSPEDLTGAQATALLSAVAGDSGSGGTKGLVPAPAAGDAAAGKVLDASGAFVALASKHMPAGSVVDSAYAEFTTFNTTNTIIPLDDTIPQNTEGAQILSATITPKSTTNKLRVRAEVPCSITVANAAAVVAVFRNSVADALAANWRFDAPGLGGSVIVEFDYTPGVTTAEIIVVRVGVSTTAGGQTLALNGIAAGRLMGGVSRATLSIQEIKA